MSKDTQFKEGNQWQFSKDCQPSRRMTSKQTLKAIDNLICMSGEELNDIADNEEAPMFLRLAAQRLIGGDCAYVVELREKYAASVR